ncbi:ferritin-like protein [Mesorhizobium sp. M0013]|uniref:ferritin-like domain-containing protein n=1 Tax=Mesorhizobium sp. M0013 TaxID=2956841 RepID=UPI003335FC79
MASLHRPLTVNPRLAESLRNIQTSVVRDESARLALGSLLQSALELEFATVPTYLSAAFSLTSNREVQGVVLRTAQEEMLHMTAVANIMNAIGIAPSILAAVPTFPYHLSVLDPPLRLDLCSFSSELVRDLFMKIEAPEEPVLYKMDVDAAEKPTTIGQFYAGIIQVIESDAIPDLFENAVRDAYKQREVTPNFKSIAYLSNQDNGRYPLKPEIDFRITDKETAVRHLAWVVDQGEGEGPFDPLTAEGIPGHYYRFESILKAKFLIKDDAADLGYSFSGGDLPFDPAGVHAFDDNARPESYTAYPQVEDRMRRFGRQYTELIDLLQAAFNCARPEDAAAAKQAYDEAVDIMRRMGNSASAIIAKARASGIKAGIPFQYESPLTS